MSFSLVTFLTFTTLLLAISGSGFELHWVAARIIIFLSLLAGVIAHWLSTSKTRLSPQDYISKPIELKAKIVAVRLLRSEEHTSELQSRPHLVCRLLLEKKKIIIKRC